MESTSCAVGGMQLALAPPATTRHGELADVAEGDTLNARVPATVPAPAAALELAIRADALEPASKHSTRLPLGRALAAEPPRRGPPRSRRVSRAPERRRSEVGWVKTQAVSLPHEPGEYLNG
jgi:hypothetical protein